MTSEFVEYHFPFGFAFTYCACHRGATEHLWEEASADDADSWTEHGEECEME